MPGSLPDLMTFAEWKKGTSVVLRTRSRELKAVDVSLEQYEHTPTAMRHARVKDNVNLAELEAHTPRLQGRTGEACTEEAARAAGADLFVRSRP